MYVRRAALLVQHYLSNAASVVVVVVVVCVFRRVKAHHHLQRYSSLLKNTCVGQVALERWLTLNITRNCTGHMPMVMLDKCVRQVASDKRFLPTTYYVVYDY